MRCRATLTDQFLRFLAVGAAGFLVDAGVLMSLVAAHWTGPVWGRLASFAMAVCVTFGLNRRWTFHGARGSVIAQMARYLGVQSVGFTINLAIYALLYASLPAPFNAPLLCLGVASACALIANFVGARRIVFRRLASGMQS